MTATMASVTADAGEGVVSFEMPELGTSLTAGEAERLGQAWPSHEYAGDLKQ
jgi:hypothetical protein